jgi:hypothetical protein
LAIVSVGVPDTVPVFASITNPLGNPTTLYEYASEPPLALAGLNAITGRLTVVATEVDNGVNCSSLKGGNDGSSAHEDALTTTNTHAASVRDKRTVGPSG